MKYVLSGVVALMVVFVAFGEARGEIDLGSLTFDENAFADAAELVAGDPPPPTLPPGLTWCEALCGANLSTSVEEVRDNEVIFELRYVDNAILNGPGVDLVVYEMATQEAFSVAVKKQNGEFTDFLRVFPALQGFSVDGREVSAGLFDLDDFGIPANATVTTIRLIGGPANGGSKDPDIAAAGALNSVVPEPSIFALLTAGAFALLAYTWRRRRK